MNVVHPAAADGPPAHTPVSVPTPASPRDMGSATAIRHSPSLSPTSAVGIPHGLRSDHAVQQPQHESHYTHHPGPQSPTPTSSGHGFLNHHSPRQQHQSHRQMLQSTAAAATSSPPMRQDNASSVSTSTQATAASQASVETSNTSYSADTSPKLHHASFYLKDGSHGSLSNTRRTSRRRTGPLSQASRERAALIRKLGACNECRKRRVAVGSLSVAVLLPKVT